MIPCYVESVAPLEERALQELFAKSGYRRPLPVDADFLEALPAIHGGTPVAPFYTAASGVVRRIGWLVTLYDDRSSLPGPFQEDHMYHEGDTRQIDRGLPYLLDGEMSIYGGGDDEVRFYPFAALYEDAADDRTAPFTLAWHFGHGADSLCFDTSTTPPAVVYCNFDQAVAALLAWEYDGQPYDYSRLQPVAPSFRDFAATLRDRP